MNFLRLHSLLGEILEKKKFSLAAKFKGFSKYIKTIFFNTYLKNLCFKQFSSPNRMNRCDCRGHLDTKIEQIDLCHISTPYASARKRKVEKSQEKLFKDRE
jgi:hypothetical protein